MQSSVEHLNELKNLSPTFPDNIRKNESPKQNLFLRLNKNNYSPSQFLKINKIELDLNIKSHQEIAR